MTKEEIKQKMIKAIGTFNNDLISSIAERCADVAFEFSVQENATLTSEVERLKQEVERLTKLFTENEEYARNLGAENRALRKDKNQGRF